MTGAGKVFMKTRLLFLLAFVLSSSPVLAGTVVFLPDGQKFADNEPDILVKTTLPGSFKTLEGIAGALLALSGQAANKELSNPFDPKAIQSTSRFEGARGLIDYYRGARLEKEGIIISFSGEAMRYLNNTVSIQQFVKGAIEGTLLYHFPEADKIHYEIDGEIVDEWDA